MLFAHLVRDQTIKTPSSFNYYTVSSSSYLIKCDLDLERQGERCCLDPGLVGKMNKEEVLYIVPTFEAFSYCWHRHNSIVWS